MWRLGGLSPWRLMVRVYGQALDDRLMGRSAELAYFFLFSVFPLLLFLTTLLGYLAQENWGLRQELFRWVSTVSPSTDVTELLRGTLGEITEGRKKGGPLSLSLVVAVWVASNGMLTLSRTLNAACGLEESRAWYVRRGVSILLVTVFALFTIAGLAVIFAGEWMAEKLSELLGYGDVFVGFWSLFQWGVVLLMVVLAFDLIYNVAPNLSRRHWVWLTPGACVGVSLWLLSSFGLRVYLSSFGTINKAYGSLGAVIVLMIWFYIAAAAILVGGEVNSEISRAALGSRELRSRD